LEDSANNCTDAHLQKDQFGSADVHYLIDFDTAWMAADPADYQRTCEKVREESKHLSDANYKEQRLKVSDSLEFYMRE
jgi:predicted metal-dependent HD superfamily phosphohydrolase